MGRLFLGVFWSTQWVEFAAKGKSGQINAMFSDISGEFGQESTKTIQ